MRERREMDLRLRVVEEERLALFDVAFHERDAAFGALAVDGAPRLHVERLDVARRLADLAFPDERCVRRRRPLSDPGLRLVAGAGYAVELVETLVRRFADAVGLVAAEVPLAEQR